MSISKTIKTYRKFSNEMKTLMLNKLPNIEGVMNIRNMEETKEKTIAKGKIIVRITLNKRSIR
jgi:hypothetical protein